MDNIFKQFSQFEVARYRIVLQAQTEAVLPALIGSTLRGAFGHALKAISCCVPHKNCRICFLSDACLYTTVFEPTSPKLKDIPRPFVFEPPIPPLTREISKNSTLKLRVAENGKISFDFILMGKTIKKLPYFIYAFELLARHGLGVSRQSFKISEVFSIDANSNLQMVYAPHETKILLHQNFDLGNYIQRRITELKIKNKLKINLLTPLRIRRNRDDLLEKITFTDLFKQCSLRLKFLSENYGNSLEYDYQNLMNKTRDILTFEDKLWRHNFTRHSNRQNKKFDLDGMLGEIEFHSDNFAGVLPFIIAGEFLNIGSASSLGLGKFTVEFV
ncbi:CRISPR-associated endoribonuclease Cas6 [soil metagenome]